MKHYHFKLYIIGSSVLAKKATKHLQTICKEYLQPSMCQVEVIDLLDDPSVAESESIIATPIVIRYQPEPQQRVIGDLSDHEKVAEALGIE